MSEELLRCPHCGGEASTPTNWGDPSRPIPRCRDCRAEAPSPEAWNRRPPAPDVSRLLAAAKEVIINGQRALDREGEGPLYSSIDSLDDAIAAHEAARPDHVEPAEFGWTEAGYAARREAVRLAGEAAQPE